MQKCPNLWIDIHCDDHGPALFRGYTYHLGIRWHRFADMFLPLNRTEVNEITAFIARHSDERMAICIRPMWRATHLRRLFRKK